MAEVHDKATCEIQNIRPFSLDSSCQPDNCDPAENTTSKLQKANSPSDDLSRLFAPNKVATTGHLHNTNNYHSAFTVTEDAAAAPTDVEITGVFCKVNSDVLNNALVANVYQSSQAHDSSPDDSNTMPLHDAAIHISHSTQSLAGDDDYDEIVQYITARDDEIIKLPGDPAYFPLINQCTIDDDKIIKLHEDPAYSSTIL